VAQPAEPPVSPRVAPPNTLAIEEPTRVDYLWWTVAGVSAGALLVTATLATIAWAAPPAQPRSTLGRIDLP
jgi:hypothetical protein